MNVCRVCLSEGAKKDIFQLKSSKKDGNKGYIEIMAFCLDIQVSEDCGLPRKLCLVCFKKILSYYKFKRKALVNNTYLRSLADSEEMIKIEPLAETILVDDKYEEQELQLMNERNCLETETYLSSIKTELHNGFNDEKKVNQESNDLIDDNRELNYGKNEINHGSNDSERLKNKDDLMDLLEGDPELSDNDIVDDNVINDDIDDDQCKIVRKSRKSKKKYKSKEECESKREKDENISYPCKFCDRVFKSLSANSRHIKFTHQVVHGHCDICNKDVKHLKHHIMLMHDRDRLKFECSPCGRRFATNYRLKYHACSGSKEKRFSCSECDKRFWCPREFDRHVRSIHKKEKLFLCQFCSKSFFRKTHLNVHLRTHTREKPYSCPTCSKSFSTSDGLKNHQYVHTDRQDFECSLCAKTFAGPKYLRHHMVSHNKERKYSCKYCGVAFTRSDTRNTHQANVHEKHIATTLI